MHTPHFDIFRRDADGYVVLFVSREGKISIAVPMKERPGLSAADLKEEQKRAAKTARVIASSLCTYLDELDP